MNGDYFCGLGIVLVALWWSNRGIAARREDYGAIMRVWSALGFLSVGAVLFVRLNPSNGNDWLELGILAATGSQVLALLVAIVLPVIRFFRNGWMSRRAAFREEAERVKQTQAAAERQRITTADQQRRDSLRSDCLLNYHLHAPELRKRFSRAQYDAFVNAYLRDDMPVADVERQATKLIALIQGNLEIVGDGRSRTDILGLSRWYEEQKASIEAASMPDFSKQTALNGLYERYEELMQKHVETMRP